MSALPLAKETAGIVQFVLYAHGPTEDNEIGVISGGHSNPELTGEGIEQAKKLGQLLRTRFLFFDENYCSDLRSASVTARLVLGEGAEIICLPAFREIHHGDLDGRLPEKERDAIWEKYIMKCIASWPTNSQEIDPFFKWEVTPFYENKAETFMQLWNRVSCQIIELAKKHQQMGEIKTISIGCHHAVMQVLFMMDQVRKRILEKDSLGFYPMFFEKNYVPNGAIALFQIKLSGNEAGPIEFTEFILH